MSMELSPLSGLGRLSSGIARQTKRQTDIAVARGEIAHTIDQGRALLTSSAIGHVGNLTALSEQLTQIAPSGAAHYELLLNAYTMGAANQIARFQ